MLKLLIVLFCLGAGLALGPHLAGNKGYVLIAFDNYTVEMSVTSALFLGFLLFCALLLSLWLLRWLWTSTKRSSLWWGQQRKHQAQSNTQQGMMAMMRGDYQSAEKLVAKAANHSDTPALNYLAAAEAAQEQGLEKKRDKYLAQATQQSNNDSTVLITQARLQLKQGDYQAALNSIDQLSHEQHKLAAVKGMLLQILPKLGLWQRFLDILPGCLKLGLLSPEQERQHYAHAHQQLFEQLAQEQGADAVAEHWNTMQRKQKKQPEVAAAACRALIKAGDSKAAYQLLGDLLGNKASPLLFEVCSELELADPFPLLEQLNKLRYKHPDNPALLQTLAKLQLQQSEPEKAKEHLEACMQLKADRECYRLLGEVHTALSQPEQAADYYRQALAV